MFFHLAGAIEVFAQLVNELRSLGQPTHRVGISRIPGWLPAGDPLVAPTEALWADVSKPPSASDPYTGDGLMYRIWNYRHHVTHRRANPFVAATTIGA